MFLCFLNLMIAWISEEGKNCELVEWSNQVWPATLDNALTKLWEMYEKCKRNKIEDKPMSSFAFHNLKQEMIKLHASYERLVKDVSALLDDQQQVHERAHTEKAPDQSKMQEKYDMSKNLTEAQADDISNMKVNLT
ncbi:hypothetical protein D1007_13210 [Hordeum vulgare]|nr:hypothetical protein D1007_13210 [Hordeum vulgare]